MQREVSKDEQTMRWKMCPAKMQVFPKIQHFFYTHKVDRCLARYSQSAFQIFCRKGKKCLDTLEGGGIEGRILRKACNGLCQVFFLRFLFFRNWVIEGRTIQYPSESFASKKTVFREQNSNVMVNATNLNAGRSLERLAHLRLSIILVCFNTDLPSTWLSRQ